MRASQWLKEAVYDIHSHCSWSPFSSCQPWYHPPLILPSSSWEPASPECPVIPRGSLFSWLLHISYYWAHCIFFPSSQNLLFCPALSHVVVQLDSPFLPLCNSGRRCLCLCQFSSHYSVQPSFKLLH